MKYLLLLITSLFIVGCSSNGGSSVASFFVSDADEKKIGEQYHAELLTTLPILSSHDPRSEWIDSLGNRLAMCQDRRNFTASDFTFTVVDSNIVNAFAVPGGYIYIYTGLIEKAATADQIAGVLAHEIGHVAAEHYKEQVIKLNGLTFLQQLITGESTASQLTSNVAAYLVKMKMSRVNEYEADSLAVAYSAEEGTVSPWGMKNFLDTLDNMDQSLTLEILKTHPDPGLRSDSVAVTIENVYPAAAARPDNRPKPF